jgi:polar amino acid transport system substrate-binding protein
VFLRILISIFFIFISIVYGTQQGEDIVILEANEAPPFWSSDMYENGMAGEIVYEISKATGTNTKIVFKPLSRLIEDDTNNDLGNPAFFIVNQDFAYVIPIAIYYVSFYYYKPNQKNALEFHSIDDLKGKKIGTLKGTLMKSSYFKKEGIVFEESYSQESLFKKLKLGRLDIVIEIELVSESIISRLFPNEIDNFVKIPFSKSSYPIAIMLAQEYPNVERIAQDYKKLITSGC